MTDKPDTSREAVEKSCRALEDLTGGGNVMLLVEQARALRDEVDRLEGLVEIADGVSREITSELCLAACDSRDGILDQEQAETRLDNITQSIKRLNLALTARALQHRGE